MEEESLAASVTAPARDANFVINFGARIWRCSLCGGKFTNALEALDHYRTTEHLDFKTQTVQCINEKLEKTK
jgi:ribosomal protein L37AE/L43A